MAYNYLVQYLNEGADEVPTPALQSAINDLGLQGQRLMFKPERIPVCTDDGPQKIDPQGNAVWAWLCWFERVVS